MLSNILIVTHCCATLAAEIASIERFLINGERLSDINGIARVSVIRLHSALKQTGYNRERGLVRWVSLQIGD